MTNPQPDEIERARLNVQAAQKWLGDGMRPRRTDAERALCMNKALAHLELVSAALKDTQQAEGRES